MRGLRPLLSCSNSKGKQKAMSQLFQDDGKPAKGFKVCLATTAYENPSAAYTFALQNSRLALHEAGINSAYMLLSGNCHVDDARNSIIQEFLLTDCTDLVFLDADVTWQPEELIKLCKYENVEIVGGVYPYRRDDASSKDNMPVLMFPEDKEIDNQGLINVAGLPTGFMRIKREVIERLCEDAQMFHKKSDRRSQIPILFERAYLEGVRLGGDLNFCRKWILKGGKVQAATELHLGHVAQSVIWDSLGASMRRNDKTTLKYIAGKVKDGSYNAHLFSEGRRMLNNKWGALEDVLTMCSLVGQQADGDIIETGSGFTSIVLGASTKHKVYCLEHDERWFDEIQKMLKDAGVNNVDVRLCPIVDGWYEVPEDLKAKHFSAGLNDGPPRTLGSRMGFFDNFYDIDTIICDDADDEGYGDKLIQWAEGNKYRIDFVDRSAILRMK